MIRIAFPLIGRGAWTGGQVYLRNTLRLIGGRLGKQVEASVFLSPEENEKFGAELSPLVDGRIIVDNACASAGRGKRLARTLITGHDSKLAGLLRHAATDVVFEVAAFYGARFPIPVISWMPDFQHAHMPHMFTRTNRWRRDIGFRAQITAGRTIMISSETARTDLERLYPKARRRNHVVRFAIDMDLEAPFARTEDLRALYDLPRRFFYIPNQIWRHKNHAVVIRALARAKAQGGLTRLPPVIFSGLNKDPRNPEHFNELMAEARNAGVGEYFRYLGLIPYDHVMGLVAACDALINPSLFEGWSTPIEEAKALGAPLILSDIPIHREQAPAARFFDPASPDEAARVLLDTGARPAITRPPLATLAAAQQQRLDAHAASFLNVVTAATTT